MIIRNTGRFELIYTRIAPEPAVFIFRFSGADVPAYGAPWGALTLVLESYYDRGLLNWCQVDAIMEVARANVFVEVSS